MTDNSGIPHPSSVMMTSAIADLSNKGYTICVPVSQREMPFSFIVSKTFDTWYRIKVAYSRNGRYSALSALYGFDYCAMYLAENSKIIYPSIAFKNDSILTTIPSEGEYYWFEDFLDLTDEAEKRKVDVVMSLKKKVRPDRRKVERPNRAILTGQIRALGYTGTGRIYGVTDTAIRKWENSLDED